MRIAYVLLGGRRRSARYEGCDNAGRGGCRGEETAGEGDGRRGGGRTHSIRIKGIRFHDHSLSYFFC